MKVLLLLAGQSKRFWPLREKSLFPVCGKTLLEHQIERLQDAGLTDIVLVGGAHNLEPIQQLFPDLPTVEQQDLSLGMRGALLSALPGCGTDSVMIVSGNDVFDSSAYSALIASAKNVDGALLAQKVETYFPGGYLEIEGDRITSIMEKPGKGNEPSDLVNIVAHVHNSPNALLEALQIVDESSDDGYEQALQKLFKKAEYAAVPYKGNWKAVKYPWHLLGVMEMCLGNISEQSIHKSVEIHTTATVSGSVILEEGVRVFAGASVVGPCYIGKNSIVANGTLVRGSCIGSDCVVGYNTEVKGSLLHSNVWTHMTYIGDSIVGRNVSFGGGCVTGNLRLDEGGISSVVQEQKVSTQRTKFGLVVGNNSRLGIQVSSDPGVKIGESSFVSSASHIRKDIPEKSFARMKGGELVISTNTAFVPEPEDREKYRKTL